MSEHFSARNRRCFLYTTSGLAVGGALAPYAYAQEVAKLAPTSASSKRGVVATVHPLASRAAIEAFERGGNAIDAAVAASLMLSVVDGHNSGIGGGCLALVRTAKGELFAIDGRERAPMKATPDMFFRNGKPDPSLSQLGPLAAGVPGLIAALEQLNSRWGKAGWKQSLLGAARIAQEGFPIDANYARNLKESAAELSRFAESKRILLNDSDKPPVAGTVLKQTDLAKTLTSIAEKGAAWFYRGGFAEMLEQFMRDTGGLMKASDLAEYKAVDRSPIKTGYRGSQVIGFPPPSSGGVHVAQMLGMLSQFDVKAIFDESPARGFHLILEVMKRAMADRAHWLGDSDFVDVPLGLIDAGYLRERAGDIDLSKAKRVTSHGQPPSADASLFGRQKHTTHLTTADQEGNVVAMTQTVNTSFGCKMIVPGTGVILNNEMDDFSIAPGVRNAFGLVGSAANAVAAGKRPLSSMSPTIVLDPSGKPTLTCGVAGGPKIITTVLQVLVRVLDLGESIDRAIAAERVHHQWSPDQAVCENAVPEQVVQALRDRGHSITRIRSGAVAQGISMGADGTLTAASDPRVPSSALGLP